MMLAGGKGGPDGKKGGPKGGLLIALGLGKDVKSDSEQSAIRDMFTAARTGDWEAATAAFKRAYEACEAAEGDSEPDEDDSDEEKTGRY